MSWLTHAQWREANEYLERCWADDRMQRLRAWANKRRQHLASKPAPKAPATSGKDWRILLDRDHRDLERFAHDVFDLAFHAVPWPSGWRVRWADLSRHGLEGLEALVGTVYGMAIYSERLLLVDLKAHTRLRLDPKARIRHETELIHTILHELTHIVHPKDGHGERFNETLQRVLAYMKPEPEPVAVAAKPPAPGRPEAVKGKRWSRAGWVAAPGLDPELEYRG